MTQQPIVLQDMDAQEPLSHGEKGVHKCCIDILTVALFLLSNLALSQFSFQRDLIPLVVCAQPTMILGGQREAEIILCSCFFVIPFMS